LSKNSPTALISGVLGQDGSLLCDLLLAKGYTVIGLYRSGRKTPVKSPNGNLKLIEIDASAKDYSKLYDSIIQEFKPTEVYYLSAHHFSSEGGGQDDLQKFLEVNTLAPYALLMSLQKYSPHAHVFLAGSCHIFGQPDHAPQTESTPLFPLSYYGISKADLRFLTHKVRSESRGLKITYGILYNHESSRRGPTFVTSKLAKAAAQVKRGQGEKLVLGSLSAKVDWGYAPDYVHGFWECLQLGLNADYVFATGILHTVQDFAETAFSLVGADWREWVSEGQMGVKPPSVHPYHGDPSLLRGKGILLNQKPFTEIVSEMVQWHFEESGEQ
jgi:GDPmannose 4,6-dehydratase